VNFFSQALSQPGPFSSGDSSNMDKQAVEASQFQHTQLNIVLTKIDERIETLKSQAFDILDTFLRKMRAKTSKSSKQHDQSITDFSSDTETIVTASLSQNETPVLKGKCLLNFLVWIKNMLLKTNFN